MPRADEPGAGSADPNTGLRALAALVNAARAGKNEAARDWVTPAEARRSARAWSTFPSLAVAGTAAGLGMRMSHSVEVTSPGRPEPRAGTRGKARLSPRPKHGTGGSAPRPETDATIGPDGPVAIDREHAESWQLVQLAQAGDAEAFGALYDRYVDSVYRFVYYRVNDRTLAEDFTSETFLRALRRIGTISYQGRDIGAWFVTIARNIVLDHVKSARNRLEFPTADTIEGREHASSTEATVLESLASEQLMAAIAQLGDEQRECVLLRFIQGFSVSETAEVLGKTDGAVKALQHRAVRKLAELVGTELR